MTANNPTVARRVLGFALRDMRKSRNLTLDEVHRATDISMATLSKTESARQSLHPNSVAALLSYYDVPEAQREKYLELARLARSKGWWTQYQDLMGVAYLGLEAAAKQISYLENHVVPGLLQTRAYLEALIIAESPGVSEDELKRRTAARTARQEILKRKDSPCELLAILDESVLRRPVGSAEVMAEQLDHILEMLKQPNVRVQIMPFAAGAHAALTARFTILRFADATDPGTAHVEHLLLPDQFVEEPDHVRAFADTYARAAEAAESPARSIAMITSARDNFLQEGRN